MAEKILEQVLDYFMHPRNAWLYGQDIHRAITEFSPSEQLPEDAFDFFIDWLAFDFDFRPGMNLISYAAKENPMQCSPAELNKLTEMGESRFDFFEVAWSQTQGVKQFVSVRDATVYELPNGERTRRVRPGEVIVCRIARANGGWCLVMDMGIGMYKPNARDRKRMKNDFPTLNSKILYEKVVRPSAIPIEAEFLDNGEMFVSGFGNDTSSHQEDDGCAICRAMRAAKLEGRSLSHNELLRAFEEANREQDKKRPR